MRFKDFEIQPTAYLDGHIEPKQYEVVKWEKHDPIEVIDLKTGEKKMSDTNCFSIASIHWNDREPCWEFKSVGTRFLRHYEEGLCEYILKWLELRDICDKYNEDDISDNN